MNSMEDKLGHYNLISHYIPERIINKISGADQFKFARTENLDGGVIFFDLVKFTPLTSLLARGGPRGAERLQEILLLYFTKMINIIRQFGGSVYQFAGDSAMAAFERKPEESQSQAAARTATCVWQMKMALKELEPLEIEGEKFQFRTKFSISYGSYYQIILGNQENFFDAKILGTPVYSVVNGEKYSLADSIVIDNEMAGILPEGFYVERNEGYSMLSGVDNPVDPVGFQFEKIPVNNSAFVKRCSRFILPVLVKKIMSNYQGFLGEFRDITSVFIQFDGLEYLQDISSSVKLLNSFFESIVDTANIFGGTLVQTDFSDKGNVFLVIFGAPVAVEQKELMAIKFSQKIHEMRSELPFLTQLKIGISTGLSYCGDMGSDVRKSYTVLGESVNYASRIMSQAADKSTCVDVATYEKIKDVFSATPIENVTIKGISDNVTLYKISGDLKKPVVKNIHKDRLFGRKKEIEIFNDMLKKQNTILKSLTLIGDAGVGKSRLVQEFSGIADSQGINVVISNCYSYEKFTPFFPWRNIYYKLFNLGDNDSDKVKIFKIRESIESLSDVRKEWVPVFAIILGISVEEDSFTANLEPRQKNERISHITIELLQKKALIEKTLFVIEDFHWIDDASYNLFKYVLNRPIENIMYLIAMRPEKISDSLKSIENMKIIELKELESSEARQLLRNRLNLLRTDEDVENEILSRANGNPFFIESIIFSLREQKQLIPLEHGKYKLVADSKDVKIPNTLQDVLLSRIDRLREEEQSVLKIAAVIGRIFTVEMLNELLPENIKSSVETALSSLEINDFTSIEAPDPLSYIFKHILIRDVAYNSILLNTRKDIHWKLAKIIEAKSAENFESSIDILAYHYLNSHDTSRALEYCNLAAERALAQYANLDAVFYFEKSLELLNLLNVSEGNKKFQEIQENLAKAYGASGMFSKAIEFFEKCLEFKTNNMDKSGIYIGIGKVYSDMGDTKKAVKSLEKGLRLVGGSVPRTLLGTYLSIGKCMLIHEINKILPFTIHKVKENSNQYRKLKKQSEIFYNLDKIYFFEFMEKLAWSNFNNVIIADKLKDPALTSLAYANYGMLLVSMGMFHRAQKSYEKSAEYAEISGDAVVKAISSHRLGMRGFYTNTPFEWREKMQEALITFEEVSDLFEIYVTITGIAVSNVYSGDFSEALKYYRKLEDLAKKHQANRFLAWTAYTIPFIKYMIGETIAESARASIKRGILLAEEMNDFMAIATGWNFLCVISIRENDLDRIYEDTLGDFNNINKLNIFVPDTHIAYAHAADGALLCLHHGIGNKRILKKIVRIAGNKLYNWGKTFSYVYGPGIRIKAQYYDYIGKKDLARQWHLKSIDVHEKTDNKWEIGLAYFEAGKALEDKREEFLQKAENIFREKNFIAESERLSAYRNSLKNA